MKRFLFMCVMVAALALTITSCKEVKPDFRFSLNLNGVVVDSATNINADFIGHVANDSVENFYLAPAEKVMSIECEEGKEANDWLDTYMDANVLNELNTSGTKYSITVRGRVRELVSGTEFSVYKTYSNITDERR